MKNIENKFYLQSNKKNRIQGNRADKIMYGIFYVICVVFSFLCLYPFLQVLISSFADETTILIEGYKLIPSKFSLEAYRVVFNGSTIMDAYWVTIVITVIGTVLQVVITAMAAYALSGQRLKYRGVIGFLYYFTMLFSGGMVSSYLLITQYLHLDDTIWVYILPAAFNVWNCFLLRAFFNEIPKEIIESAQIDGANQGIIMFMIVIPLSLPAIATIALFAAVGFWNEWAAAQFYISDPKLYTLQYQIVLLTQSIDAATKAAQSGMGNTTNTIAPANTVRLATAIITVGPIIFLYPFLQKYFVAGLRVGGVKG